MSFENFNTTDGAYSTLDAGIAAIDASIQFAAGEGSRFASANQILTIVQYATPDDPTTAIVKEEKILLLTRSGDTGTVTRGYDGTTATSFDFGDRVYGNVVSKIIDDIQTEVARLETDKLDIDDYQNGLKVYAASSGGTDSYAITLSPPPASYLTAQVFRFQADVGNTGAATLNVNGLGAKTIKKLRDQDLITGDIEAGQIVEVAYDGTNFQMNSQIANIPSIDINGLSVVTPAVGDFIPFYDISGGGNAKATTQSIIDLFTASNAQAHAGSATNVLITPYQLANFYGPAPIAGTTITDATSTTETNVTGTTPTKKYQMTITRTGTYTVTFNIGRNPSGTAGGRIYKNGVAFGTLRSSTQIRPAVDTFAESLAFTAADTCELWIYNGTVGENTKCNVFLIQHSPATATVTTY